LTLVIRIKILVKREMMIDINKFGNLYSYEKFSYVKKFI